VTKALIGDQHKYSLSAGLQIVKLFHGLLHYVDQIKKFGSPLRSYYFGGLLFGIILEGQAQEINPSKRINSHLHRVQHDILICSQESRQFGHARQVLFPMEYAPVFCGTNLLSLDELQVNGEGDGNTEILGFSDICSDNDDSEVVREANTDHSLGEYSAMHSKSGRSERIFQVPKQSKFSAGLNQDQQWVILGERAWCLSTCVAKTMGLGTINCTTLGLQMRVFL
jgi:hypothetical protein